ncbi:unnamed protein product [Penicillium glandicola]
MLNCIGDCIFGRLANDPLPPADPRPRESIASAIVTKILTADTPYSLHKQVNEEISIDSWTETLAKAILQGLENAIKSGANMARAASDAAAQSKTAAVQLKARLQLDGKEHMPDMCLEMRCLAISRDWE